MSSSAQADDPVATRYTVRAFECASQTLDARFRGHDMLLAACGVHAAARAKRRGLLQGQDRQPADRLLASAAATTSTRGIWRATWASTFPGRPTIVPQNMTGAGSLRAASFLYSAAPKDGTAFGTFARTTGITPLLESGAQLRRHQVHLARQRDQRRQHLRHLAHLAGEDLEGLPGEAGRRSAGRARAPIPTSSRSSTRTCSAPRSSSSPAIPAPTRSRSRWSAARSTACADCPGARSRPATPHWLQRQEDQHPGAGGVQEGTGAWRRAAGHRSDQGSREAADPQADPGRAGDGAAVRGAARHSRPIARPR